MNIELIGDQPLYQWDSGRQVQVDSADFIHFANYGDSTAHVVKPWESPIEGKCLAYIPNDLFATGKDVLVWRYTADHTLDSARLRVIPRAKPDDYVYESNVPTLTELIQNLIDDSLGEVVKGEAATVAVGKVETVPYETGASVVNSGTENDAVFDFQIPAGQKGDPGKDGKDGQPGRDGEDGQPGRDGVDGKAASLSIGQVVTGEPGTQASVINVGTATDAVLNITIPRGAQGVQGIQGEPGEPGSPGQKGDPGEPGSPGEKGDKGDPGSPGAAGQDGQDGADATINGVNALTLSATGGISAVMEGSTLTLSGAGLASETYVAQQIANAVGEVMEASY